MKNHLAVWCFVGDHVYGHSDGAGWICQGSSRAGGWVEKANWKGAIAYADGMLYCIGEDSGKADQSAEGWNERTFQADPQTTIRSPSGKSDAPCRDQRRLYLRDRT